MLAFINWHTFENVRVHSCKQQFNMSRMDLVQPIVQVSPTSCYHTHTHTHVHISLDYTVWTGNGLINQLVHPPMRLIKLAWCILFMDLLICHLKSERRIEVDVSGNVVHSCSRIPSSNKLGNPIQRSSTTVCGMLIGNYYTPKEHVEATPEAKQTFRRTNNRTTEH